MFTFDQCELINCNVMGTHHKINEELGLGHFLEVNYKAVQMPDAVPADIVTHDSPSLYAITPHRHDLYYFSGCDRLHHISFIIKNCVTYQGLFAVNSYHNLKCDGIQAYNLLTN
jgi:hypothetical protein